MPLFQTYPQQITTYLKELTTTQELYLYLEMILMDNSTFQMLALVLTLALLILTQFSS